LRKRNEEPTPIALAHFQQSNEIPRVVSQLLGVASNLVAVEKAVGIFPRLPSQTKLPPTNGAFYFRGPDGGSRINHVPHVISFLFLG